MPGLPEGKLLYTQQLIFWKSCHFCIATYGVWDMTESKWWFTSCLLFVISGLYLPKKLHCCETLETGNIFHHPSTGTRAPQ